MRASAFRQSQAMKVSFKGGLEIEAALKALGDKGAIKRTAERALKRAAEPIRDKAKELAPKDERHLEESISIGRAIQAFQRTSSGDVVRTFVGIDESKDARLHRHGGLRHWRASCAAPLSRRALARFSTGPVRLPNTGRCLRKWPRHCPCERWRWHCHPHSRCSGRGRLRTGSSNPRQRFAGLQCEPASRLDQSGSWGPPLVKVGAAGSGIQCVGS